MIIGLGVDTVELIRISAIYRRFGKNFYSKILTPHEISLLSANPIPFLAGRFAAKEAAVKALGTGFNQGIGFQDIEISSGDSGEPIIKFFNRALVHCQSLFVSRSHISISHSRDNAVAVVILER